jgi:hypothetical protein
VSQFHRIADILNEPIAHALRHKTYFDMKGLGGHHMKTRTVAFLCAVSLLTTLTVFAENVSGTWKGSYPGRDGQTRESTIVLKADGEKLTGTVAGGRGESEIKDGTIKAATLLFRWCATLAGTM